MCCFVPLWLWLKHHFSVHMVSCPVTASLCLGLLKIDTVVSVAQWPQHTPHKTNMVYSATAHNTAKCVDECVSTHSHRWITRAVKLS
jgi:hypothetical protein